jgi:predicted Zn-dependent protease
MWAIKAVLAASYAQCGRAADAERVARDAVHQRPEQLWPNLQLAQTLAMQDRIKEARAALALAVGIKPDMSLTAINTMLL